jgi:hypothetical protein
MTTETKMPELLPCPFCGSAPVIRPQGNEWTKSRRVTIKCPECRIERSDAAIRHDMDWLIAQAIDGWNRRASPSPPADVLPAPLAATLADLKSLMRHAGKSTHPRAYDILQSAHDRLRDG